MLAGLTLSPHPPQLYSELRGENERLREALTETTLRLAQLKVELERATQVRPQARGAGPCWRGCAWAGKQDQRVGGGACAGPAGTLGREAEG